MILAKIQAEEAQEREHAKAKPHYQIGTILAALFPAISLVLLYRDVFFQVAQFMELQFSGLNK